MCIRDRVEGIAIVHPRYFNRSDVTLTNQEELMYQVEYSSVATSEYDQMMVVAISGYTLSADIFSIDNLKMKVTKKGDIITLIGNSNHPNAVFFDPSKKGFSYAFVAKGDQAANIGSIKLSLAPCTLDSTDILSTHSVANAITGELNYYVTQAGYSPAAEPFKTCITNILANCQSPAYYSAGGYQSCGSNKPMVGNYDAVSALDGLVPYSPKEVSTLAITFGE